MTPSLTQTTQRSGTDATVNLAVAWSDKSRVDTVGVHDVYMVAIDKSVILLRGDNNNLNPKRVRHDELVALQRIIYFGMVM